MMSKTQTYYEVLDVTQSASHQEIVAAYQRAKSAYADDSTALYTMFSKQEADELRKIIEEAFLILGNEAKRREYDQVIFSRLEKNLNNSLPDFAPIQEKTLNEVNITNQSPKQIPEGFAKSRLSVYEKNQAIENEINSTTQVDGPFLRKIRQYKNINIDQMSKDTKISRSYLQAIESEDREALPAPVFVRGFILQYARLLGLNEQTAVSSYMDKINKV